MKLYLVHCGFYDEAVSDGLYESHTNFFVAAADFDEARRKAKLMQEFKSKRMHIDGLQEIAAVNGHRVQMVLDQCLDGESVLPLHKHRQLAPTQPSQ